MRFLLNCRSVMIRTLNSAGGVPYGKTRCLPWCGRLEVWLIGTARGLYECAYEDFGAGTPGGRDKSIFGRDETDLVPRRSAGRCGGRGWVNSGPVSPSRGVRPRILGGGPASCDPRFASARVDDVREDCGGREFSAEAQ